MSLIKSIKFGNVLFKQGTPAFTTVRHHWNKDYKPGLYPTTQEQKLKAAERYGLHPEEYEVYPDDGTGFGDYPKIPKQSGDSKDPFYPWDYPALKRNFGEVIHADNEMIREDRYDVNAKLHLPMWKLWLQFLGTLAGFYFFYQLGEGYKMFHPLVPRQYPEEGKKHYTFETE